MKITNQAENHSLRVECKEKTSTDSKESFHRYRLKKYIFSPSIKKQLKPLFKKDNYHGVLAVLRDYLCFTVAIGLSVFTWKYFPLFAPIVYCLSVFLIGINQRALATLLHEASHKSLTKNKKLNFVLGTFCSGYWIFQTFHRYVQSHCKGHHPFLGNADKDPDYQYYDSQGLFNIKNKQQFLQEYLRPNFLLQKLPNNLAYLFTNRLFMPNFSSQPFNFKREYFFFIFFWVCLIGGMWHFNLLGYFFLFWIVPYLTVFQILNSTIEVCEHYPIILHDSQEIYMTRNRNGSRFELFLMGIHGENYHLIHHLFPAIPFWNLKKAHQVLLQDEEYLFIDERSGGIITKSRVGAKTIIESMFAPLFQVKPI